MEPYKDREITIDLSEYKSLIISAEHYTNIIRIAFRGAKLSWNKEYVDLDRDGVEDYIRTIQHEAYTQKFKQLSEEVKE